MLECDFNLVVEALAGMSFAEISIADMSLREYDLMLMQMTEDPDVLAG